MLLRAAQLPRCFARRLRLRVPRPPWLSVPVLHWIVRSLRLPTLRQFRADRRLTRPSRDVLPRAAQDSCDLRERGLAPALVQETV